MKRLATPMPCTRTTGIDPAETGSTETRACIRTSSSLIHLLRSCPVGLPNFASVTAAPTYATEFARYSSPLVASISTCLPKLRQHMLVSSISAARSSISSARNDGLPDQSLALWREFGLPTARIKNIEPRVRTVLSTLKVSLSTAALHSPAQPL